MAEFSAMGLPTDGRAVASVGFVVQVDDPMAALNGVAFASAKGDFALGCFVVALAEVVLFAGHGLGDLSLGSRGVGAV